MPRYFVKSYSDSSTGEKRYAVERQDGSIHRILKRDFVTDEGASVWLARYQKVKRERGNNLRRDMERRSRARSKDPRRLGTSMGTIRKGKGIGRGSLGAEESDFDEDDSYLQQLNNTAWKKFVQSVLKAFSLCLRVSIKFAKDSVFAVPFLLGVYGRGGWNRAHVRFVWCADPVGLDLFCSTIFCWPCLNANVQKIISRNEWEKMGKTSSWPGQTCAVCAVCCCPCNRRRVALHYSVDGESCPQSWMMAICCPFCSCCQILHEVSYRENSTLGKPCMFCCCECVFSGKALGDRYLNRSLAPSRGGPVAPLPVDMSRSAAVSKDDSPNQKIRGLNIGDMRAAKLQKTKTQERREWLGRPFTVASAIKQTQVWLHHGSYGKPKDTWSL